MAEKNTPDINQRKKYEQTVRGLIRAAKKINEAYQDLISTQNTHEEYKAIANSINETFWKMQNLYEKEKALLSPENLRAVEGLEFKVEMISLPPVKSSKPTTRDGSLTYLQHYDDAAKAIREAGKQRRSTIIQ